MTTEQAQAAIAKRYVAGGFFTDPQVSVFAKEYVTQGVSVLGEVQKPGVYPVLGARTLFDVLSLAGGTTPKAGKLVSITHRDHPQTPISVSLSNDAGPIGAQQRRHLPRRHHRGFKGRDCVRGRRCPSPQRSAHGEWFA